MIPSSHFKPNKILLTGCCGFIGSNFLDFLFKMEEAVEIVNIDCLTYAANLNHLDVSIISKKYKFVQEDIRNHKKLDEIFRDFKPDTVINFAAESHVDNSIDNPSIFIETNVNGTLNLLNLFQIWYFPFRSSKY